MDKSLSLVLILFFALWVAAAVALPPVTIDVLPRAMLPGATIRLRCMVPRDAANRWIDYGIEDVSSSGMPWEGEQAAVTRQVFIDHVPCGAGDAFCAVRRADGSVRRATTSLTVAGCGE